MQCNRKTLLSCFFPFLNHVEFFLEWAIERLRKESASDIFFFFCDDVSCPWHFQKIRFDLIWFCFWMIKTSKTQAIIILFHLVCFIFGFGFVFINYFNWQWIIFRHDNFDSMKCHQIDNGNNIHQEHNYENPYHIYNHCQIVNFLKFLVLVFLP